MHNATVDATTSGQGAVAEMTLAEIRALDAAVSKPQFRGTRVPTLDEALAVMRGKCGVYFDAKQIAAATGLEAKPLYRRIEQIVAKLGQNLQAAGLTKDEVLDLLRNPDVDLGEILNEELRKPKPGPSTPENAGGDE